MLYINIGAVCNCFELQGPLCKAAIISPFPGCELNRGVFILFLIVRVRELGEKRGEV